MFGQIINVAVGYLRFRLLAGSVQEWLGTPPGTDLGHTWR